MESNKLSLEKRISNIEKILIMEILCNKIINPNRKITKNGKSNTRTNYTRTID
jgi:hypothetical protein